MVTTAIVATCFAITFLVGIVIGFLTGSIVIVIGYSATLKEAGMKYKDGKIMPIVEVTDLLERAREILQ